MTQRTRALAGLALYLLLLPLFFVGFARWADAAATARPNVWGDPHVGVVVDTTATMQPELDALVNAFHPWGVWREPLTATLHLVGFKDAAATFEQPEDVAAMAAALDAIEASGGGNCPDGAFAGLREMAMHLPGIRTPSADVLLATDSTPLARRQDYHYMANRMLQRGVRVHSLLSGWCDPAPISPEALGFLSLATGGSFYPTDGPDYTTDAAIALTHIAATDELKRLSAFFGDPADVPLLVDSTMESFGIEMGYIGCLTCPLQIDSGDPMIQLIDPDGTVIDPSDPGFTELRSARRLMVHWRQPLTATVAGEWTVRVNGASSASLAIFATSDLHLAYLGAPTLPLNRPSRLQAVLGEVNDLGVLRPPLTATFQLQSLDGQMSMPVELFDDGMHGDDDAGDGLYGGRVTPQHAGMWQLVAEGKLMDGSLFQRVAPEPIRVRSFRAPSPSNGQLVPGGNRSLRFSITNEEPEGSGDTTFDLALYSDQGWAMTDTLPAQITLAPGERFEIAVPVQAPPGAPVGTVEETALVAVPVNDLEEGLTATSRTTVVSSLSLYLPLVREAPAP